MKIVYINSFNCGSTGNLMLGIASYIKKQGDEFFFCCPSSRTNKRKNLENQIFIGNRFSRNLHILLSQITGIHGLFSCISTRLFLAKINQIRPDIIHLNNLHNSYINIPMLFNYIKNNNISVVWTLHDCWAFTAYCPHFSIVKCNKWKYGCYECPQYRNVFSRSPYIDNSSIMWNFKRKWFTGVRRMQIVTPSYWLSSLVKYSFLHGYDNRVIYNGIDISVFYPRESDFKAKNDIENRYLVLGVSAEWGYRKGLDVFVRLSEHLDKKFQIVLVGIDDDMLDRIPANIICISKTDNQAQLAKIYSAADVFVNPTREEVLGLVNLEALACGTPVITFNSGGSPETIDETCGYVVSENVFEQLIQLIIKICEQHPFSAEACVNRAKKFNINLMCKQYYQSYLQLYDEN